MATLQELFKGKTETQTSQSDRISEMLSMVGETQEVKEEAPSLSGFGEFKQDIGQTISGIKERANIRADRFGEAQRVFDADEQGAGAMAFQKFGQGAGFAADVAGELVKGAVKSVLPQEQENQVKDFLSKIIARTQEQGTPGVPVGEDAKINLINEYEKLKETNPNLARTIDSAGGILSLAAELTGFGQGSRAIKKVGKEAVEESLVQTTRFADNLVKNADEAQDAISIGVNRIKSAEPQISESLSDGIANAYRTSFVDDRVSINNKLNKIAKGKDGVTKETLVQDLANEGLVPSVNGKMADMNPAIETLDSRIENLASQLDETLSPFTEARTLEELRQQSIAELKSSRFPKGQIIQGENFVNNLFDSYAKAFPNGKLTPQQMNSLRIELNRQFKEGVDVDAAEVVGDIMRRNLDEIAPITTEVNQEIGRLIDLRKTANVFNNVPIDVGVLGGQLGRMLGALGAGIGGAAIAGPGGLVISGIAAHYGGNVVAQILRSRKFSKEAVNLLEAALKRDDELLKRMIDTADAENKAIFQRLLPAPAPGAPRIQSTGGKVINLTEEAPSTVEAREIQNLSPKGKGVTPTTNVSDDLIQEAKKYKSAEEFVRAQGTPVYRGDANPIKLSEMDTTKVFNPAGKEALGAFNNTPGLYFTDSVSNAKSYGKNLTEVSVKPTANVINVSDAPKILKRADIEKIVRSNPRIKDWAMNWDENFDKAIKQITDSVMAEKDGNEFLKAIWSDGGFSEGDFVKAMQNAGIDGLKVPKERVNHFVIYNKDALQTKSQLEEIWKKANQK